MKTISRRRSAHGSTAPRNASVSRYTDRDDDTYSNSLYARRNSLMATPTVRRNSLSISRPRRHSMSAIENNTRQHRRGSITATKDRLCSLLHIGGSHAHQHQQAQKPQQQPKKSLPPPSQYTYYQEEPADYDNRRPLRDFFTRRRRASEVNRSSAKNELLVSLALGKGLMFSD